MILQRFYLVIAALMTGGWLLAALGGWEWRTAPRDQIPASVRSSPGGYRSYWHGGYHGGK
jgi:hypothetical protein